MKKTLFLTLAAGLASASPLMAVDLYITGSTAFRANVYNAALKLYDNTNAVAATAQYGTAATGGNSPQSPLANNYQWTLSGTVSNLVTTLGTTPLTIHALFTGSVQGIQTVENSTPLIFLDANGNAITNSPTIVFSDVSATSVPFPLSASFSEEQVAVQPFTFVKSVAGGGLNSVTNITWEQLKSFIVPGKLPLSAWTHNAADTASYVYLINRTKDSGTRRTAFAEVIYPYNASATVYLYDNVTNNIFYKGGSTSVIGSAGNNNANLNWGPGYVGGGDVKTEMGYANVANQSVGYLSISDAKGITGTTWSQVLPYNGVWPTAAGPAIAGNSGTNDYSPISLGQYPFWSYEVIDYPNVDPSSLSADQNLTASQLGNQNTPGTILGVLDAQTKINGGLPTAGSIENEIELSKPNGATAIRLSDMHASRASVGGVIAP